MNRKLIYTLFLTFFVLSACSDRNDDKQVEVNDGVVRIQASLTNDKPVTREGTTETPTDGSYYLHYTSVYEPTELSSWKFTCAGGIFTSTSPLYWDDIKKEGSGATFYLTNTEALTFSPAKENNDILFATTTGWNTGLNFTLNHLTAKVTVVLYDNTLNRDNEGKVNFDNAKVVFYPGLNKKMTGVDYENNIITYKGTDKEKTTTIGKNNFTYNEEAITINEVDYAGVTSNPLYIVPQTFADTDSLEITAGKYVYRIPVPSQADNSRTLAAGEHLIIQIELREDLVEAEATLVNWEEISDVPPIEVSRVFNIGNWDELKDLMQAINTGYTFKGMVVRLTKDITLEGQISLGTKENPFEGIFDGNNCVIKNLGSTGQGANKGGFFRHSSGATLQNITLEYPSIVSGGSGATGALVDVAENTTIFNCRIMSSAAQEVRGTGNNIGGMVGKAIGKSTLINCYSYVAVVAEGESEYVGGLIGYSEAGITHSFATGEVLGDKADYVGGLVGYLVGGTVQYGYAQGKITGRSEVGGLIGYLDGEVTDCYASGFIKGTSVVGGLFGGVGFGGVAKSSFWYYPSENSNPTKAAGLADVDPSCKHFASQSELLSHLNNNTIWKSGENFPVFTSN